MTPLPLRFYRLPLFLCFLFLSGFVPALVAPAWLWATSPTTATPTSRQKVGLCLSGGGAKGLAHIGLLKLIDSLQIQIDYITGTSMGSIVGGLYAAGWTGKQIDSIAHTAEWEVLLNQYVPMHDIYVDEKDEYGKYIGEVAWRGRKPQFTGFIEGQTLLSYLVHLTRHVSHIHDFNQLPIPFKCMAVDIITVRPVVMDHGNLSVALRSSMSIPTVFKPVPFEGKLLVDGGVMVNFPVQELRQMGAEIVIGSYTGGRLLGDEELNSVNKLLIQTSSFYGIQEAKKNIEACAIFNNLTENMKEFQAGDFKKSEQILEIGDRICRRVLPQLVELAEHQRTAPAFKKSALQVKDTLFVVQQVVVDGLSDGRLRRFARRRLRLTDARPLTHARLHRAVRRLYATRNFYRVDYSFENAGTDSSRIRFRAIQDHNFRVKGALHYDNELGAGFIVNLTARNWVAKTSRLLLTVDAAEFFKYRLHYKKYLYQSQCSFQLELLREKSRLREFLPNGRSARDNINLYRSFNTGLNYNLSVSTALYAGFYAERLNVRPKYEKTVLLPGDSDYSNYAASIFGLKFKWQYNTLDHPFIPRKGSCFLIEYRTVPGTSFENLRLRYAFLNPATGESETRSLDTLMIANNYKKFQVALLQLFPLAKRISFVAELNGGYIFSGTKTVLSSDSVQFAVVPYPRQEMWQLGGVVQRARNNQVPLLGVNENQLVVGNFTDLQLGVQLEPLHKLYVAPLLSFGFAGDGNAYFDHLHMFNTNGRSFESIQGDTFWSFYGYGLRISYKSPLGPILLNISRASLFSNYFGYFSCGYHF